MTDELYEALTPREKDVLALLADGYRNREIADRLAISRATVKAHLTQIFQKLGVNGRAQLAAMYHGVFPNDGRVLTKLPANGRTTPGTGLRRKDQ